MARRSSGGAESAGPGQFLNEEPMRGKNRAGSTLNPIPHFVQPDTGPQSKGRGGRLTAQTDVASQPRRSSVPSDVSSGY
jgi:hypothetical protein